MLKVLNQLKSYVPRHMRLGVCCGVPQVDDVHEISEVVPFLDVNGEVVFTRSILKFVPAAEDMSRYQLKQFRLSTMLENGVPLKMVNINSNSSADIETLVKVCENLDNAEKYVERCLAQKAERDSWFKEFKSDVEETSDELNEVY